MTSELTTILNVSNDKELTVFLQHLLPATERTSSLKSNRSLLNRALFTGAVLVAFLILQAPAAVAGTGTFRDGKFNFYVSIRFNASAAEIQPIKDVFEVANQVLYDATDGYSSRKAQAGLKSAAAPCAFAREIFVLRSGS